MAQNLTIPGQDLYILQAHLRQVNVNIRSTVLETYFEPRCSKIHFAKNVVIFYEKTTNMAKF